MKLSELMKLLQDAASRRTDDPEVVVGTTVGKYSFVLEGKLRQFYSHLISESNIPLPLVLGNGDPGLMLHVDMRNPEIGAWDTSALKKEDKTPRITAVLQHSDEVSGTHVFSDGFKVYWTEGRSSEAVIFNPKTNTYTREPVDQAVDPHHIICRDQPIPDGLQAQEMTEYDELEWEKARNRQEISKEEFERGDLGDIFIAHGERGTSYRRGDHLIYHEFDGMTTHFYRVPDYFFEW